MDDSCGRHRGCSFWCSSMRVDGVISSLDRAVLFLWADFLYATESLLHSLCVTQCFTEIRGHQGFHKITVARKELIFFFLCMRRWRTKRLSTRLFSVAMQCRIAVYVRLKCATESSNLSEGDYAMINCGV